MNMKNLITIILALLLMLTLGSCRRYIYRPPVYRPVEYVPDSLIHNDIPKAEDANRELLEEIESEEVITVPPIPKESDLLREENKNMDVEKVMREGF